MKCLRAILSIAVASSLFLGPPKTQASDYETAPYEVLKKEGDFEIRSYPALKVARTANGNRSDDGAFMRLFRYIDGANEGSKKIAMTTPVFMDPKGMSFVLPQAVSSGAPNPKSDEVAVATRPARKYAVFRYSGWSSRKNEAAATERLKEWVAQSKLTTVGDLELAYYNPPWTPGPMRRNEVLIPIQ